MQINNHSFPFFKNKFLFNYTDFFVCVIADILLKSSLLLKRYWLKILLKAVNILETFFNNLPIHSSIIAINAVKSAKDV